MIFLMVEFLLSGCENFDGFDKVGPAQGMDPLFVEDQASKA